MEILYLGQFRSLLDAFSLLSIACVHFIQKDLVYTAFSQDGESGVMLHNKDKAF